MKKIIYLSILWFGLWANAQTQTVSYTAHNQDIANPERGFYKHTETHSGNYSFLSQSQLEGYRQQNITLIIRIFYLESFINSPISQTFLNNMQTDFNTIRNSGVKTIIRFAYSDNNPSAEPKDAPKHIILQHILQLQSTIYNNRDVINSLQVGFIGIYGEWYTSDNFGTGNSNLTTQNLIDRQEVLLSVLENFGWDIQIQVRTPRIKQNVFGSTPISLLEAYNLTVLKARVGHYNDCFLADATDYGTFNNESERAYLQAETMYTVNGGETCVVSEYTTCSNALFRLDQYNFDFLNIDYKEEVIDIFQSQGCFDEIKKRLGYRFELISASLSPTNLVINLRNTGFGHLANERRSYIIYRNVDTGDETSLQIDGDARLWLKGTTYSITQNIPVLPAGTYDLFLHLPDVHHDVMGLDERYSVRFANQDVWEPETGYNKLFLQLTVEPLSIKDFVAGANSGQYTIELFDMNGRKISRNDLEYLPRGIYVLRRTFTTGEIETRKVAL